MTGCLPLYLAGSGGDGGPATIARFNQPASIISDNAGGLYVADRGNQCVVTWFGWRQSSVSSALTCFPPIQLCAPHLGERDYYAGCRTDFCIWHEREFWAGKCGEAVGSSRAGA